MRPAGLAQPAFETSKPPSIFKSYYVLTLLTLIGALAFVDRNIINIVIEPIKAEFELSDTMMGFMVGFGFVMIYVFMSVPIARLADRKGRIPIVAMGLAFWSVMTTLGGFAQSVIQLLLTRIGVGIGESSSGAPTNSLIADFFPKDKRPMAMSIFYLSPYVGTYIGFWIGGLTRSLGHDWRTAFFFAGVPGLLIAALLFVSVKEPQRGIQEGKSGDIKNYNLKETLRYFVNNKTYLYSLIGLCLSSLPDFSLTAWISPFLERVHEMDVLRVVSVGSTIKLIGGMAGVLMGGVIVTRLGKKSDRWRILTPGITSLLAGPALVTFLFAPMPLGWVGLFCSVFFMGFRMGPVLGLVQTVVKVRMRAFAAAVIFMFGNLFGQGVGPFIIGVCNDLLMPVLGKYAIRYSMLSLPLTSMLGALFFVMAARHVTRDIRRSQAEQ
jgi:MFS family permease